MKKILVFAGLGLAVVAVSLFVMAAAKPAAKTEASRRLPIAADFTLKDLNSKNVTLSSFKEKKVLLVFGATWCPYCVMEIPELKAFYQKHRDKDVKLINVDIGESRAKVAAFAEKHSIEYTVVLDEDSSVARQYKLYGIPSVYLIDENGMIKYSGEEPREGFEALLK